MGFDQYAFKVVLVWSIMIEQDHDRLLILLGNHVEKKNSFLGFS